MTLDQLEMIEAVIKEGSYQAAARRLNKSQPSISVGIKKIEQEYRVELFDREHYRSQLTQAGKIFYASAQNTLRAFRRLHTLGQELGRGQEAQIRIALDPLLRVSEIHNLLAKTRGLYPALSLVFDVRVLTDSITALETHDLCVGHLPSNTEDVQYQPFCRVELVPVIARKLEPRKITHMDQLVAHPQIVLQSQHGEEGSGSEPGVTPWFVSEHYLKQELILNGLGWGRLARSVVVENQDQLFVIPTPIVQIREINLHLMRRTLKPHGPIAQYIWEHHNKTLK